MYFDSFGGGTLTGSSPSGFSAAWLGEGEGDGERVGVGSAAPPPAGPDAGTVAGATGRFAPTPARPAWLQAPVSSTAPVTAAHRPICPDRMFSTRVTVSTDNLYLCSRPGAPALPLSSFSSRADTLRYLPVPHAGDTRGEPNRRWGGIDSPAWLAGSVTSTSRSCASVPPSPM
ncbi:hypothetical protein GCM10020001_074140 [Nonomuraea salmonea]